MTGTKPFHADKAASVQFGELHTEFILPICMPEPEFQVGDGPAVLVVTTAEGQRVGLPIGVNELEQLLGVVDAGLQAMRARDGETGK